MYCQQGATNTGRGGLGDLGEETFVNISKVTDERAQGRYERLATHVLSRFFRVSAGGHARTRAHTHIHTQTACDPRSAFVGCGFWVYMHQHSNSLACSAHVYHMYARARTCVCAQICMHAW